MTLRVRLLAASAVLVLAPLALVALAVRAEMSRRIEEQYRQRTEALARAVAADLDGRGRDVGERLAALAETAREDGALRRALVGPDATGGPGLIDWSGRAMRLAGLSMLELRDRDGKILSSGQFRNDYGRNDPALSSFLLSLGGVAGIARARRPGGEFLVLARVDSVRLGGATYFLAGGWEIDRAALVRLGNGTEAAVSLAYPGGAISSDPALESRLATAPPGPAERAFPPREFLARTLEVPMIGAAEGGTGRATARLFVTHPLAPLGELRARLDRWLLLLLAGAAGGMLAISIWLSARVSRPIEALARRTAAIDLEHLDADFSSGRRDEVGTLSRFLQEMTLRLRRNVSALREAERRAALGDLARQVHHDIQGGFVPIRNVVRHLAAAAKEDPDGLARVFRERQETLEGAIAYLEDLAANTARLAPGGARVPCSLSEIVRGAGLEFAADGGASIRVETAPDLPMILADPAGIRRVVENLVRNARESLPAGRGSVTVTTSAVTGGEGGPGARLVVEDTGSGMEKEQLDRLFEGFASTKPGGSGLGLVIVRRLVGDAGGDVRVESEPGRGTRVTVTLPGMAAGAERRANPPGRAA